MPLKHYKTSLNHLRAFAKAKRVSRFPLDDVGLPFYHDFIRFLLTDLEIVNGTANNQIKRLKVVLKYAYESGLTTSRAFERFSKLTNTSSRCVCSAKYSVPAQVPTTLDRPSSGGRNGRGNGPCRPRRPLRLPLTASA